MVVPELINVWEIRFPMPPENPETFPELAEAVQVKVVPATCDRIWMFVVCCEQSVREAGV